MHHIYGWVSKESIRGKTSFSALSALTFKIQRLPETTLTGLFFSSMNLLHSACNLH